MYASKNVIRKLIKLICVGRLCDECPIQDECERCIRLDPLDDHTTMEEIINLMKEIGKEHWYE